MKAKLFTFVRGLKNGTPPRFQSYLKSLVLLGFLTIGINQVWGAEGSTHDFSQSLSQLLNNNAPISDINIAEQSYTIKEVIISYKTTQSASKVNIACSVGGTSWGNKDITSNTTTTMSFSGTVMKGAVSLSFTNKSGSGTGKGTLTVSKVTLVEGAPASPVTSLILSVAGNETDYKSGNSVGGTYTLPTEVNVECGTKSLAGWSTVEITNPVEKQPTSNFYAPGAQVTLEANNKFYAVFAEKTTGSVTKEIKDLSFTAAEDVTYSTGDDNLEMHFKKGGAGTNPGNYNSGVRLYQAGSGKSYGGYITIESTAGNITEVSFRNTSSYATSVKYSTDKGTTLSNAESVAKSGVIKKDGLSTKSFYLYNVGTTSSTRLEIDLITIKYVGTTYSNYTTSCTAAGKTAITYNKNTTDDVTGSLPEMVEQNNNTEYTVSTATLSRIGYSFIGWNTDKTASVGIATIPASQITGTPITLYAIWSANTYDVVFNGNGADGGTTMGNQSIKFDASDNLNQNTYTRTGHTFQGWATTESGQVTYADKATYTMTSTGATLYAVWKPNQHKITYVLGEGGSGCSNINAQNYGTTVILCTNAERAYHTFAGWTSEDVTIVDNQFTMPDKDVTITATWTEFEKYTVTFKNNGEPIDGFSRQVYAGDGIGTVLGVETALPTLTSTDAKDARSKTFVGWTEATIDAWTNDKPTLITADEIINAEITYNAVWVKETEGTGYTNNYQRITSTADLTPGDYAFVGEDDFYGYNLFYYALNKTTYKSFYLTATEVTSKLSNDLEKLSNITDNDIVWTIAFKNNDNSKISIKNGNSYLNIINSSGHYNLKYSSTSDYFTYSVNNGLWKFVSENQSEYMPFYDAEHTDYTAISKNTSVEGQLYLYKRIHNIVLTDYITHSSSSPLASIELNTTGVKTNYFVGETFTSAGLTATATLGDGITFPVEHDDLIFSTPDLTTAGEKTVTVEYTFNGATKSNTYTVNAYSVTINSVYTDRVDDESVNGNTYNWNKQTHALTFTEQAHYRFNGITNVVGATLVGEGLSYTLSDPTANVTLTATWQRLFTLQYNSKGGAAVSSVVDVTKNTTVETKPTPNNTGYNLVGWYNNESYTGDAVTFPYAITKDETLYAKWEVKTTEITFSQTDATTKGTEKVIATWGQPMPEATMPQREHYQFAGYKHNSTLYYNANGTSAKNWDKEFATATLTAQWTPNKHKVIFTNVLVGGSIKVNNQTSTINEVDYNSTVTITAIPNTHYTLTALTWNGNDILSTPSFTMPDEDVMIAATFTEDTKRTISWSVGGQIVSTTADVYDGTAFAAIKANAPTVEDDDAGDCADKFMGWAIAPINTQGGIDEGAVQWADEATTSETQNTFYAVFAKASGSSVEETYTFESFTSGKSVSFESTNYDIEFNVGTGTSNPTWASNQARLYAKGYCKISSKNTISKIVYNYVINENKNGVIPTINGANGKDNAGSWDANSKTWTGSDKEVTLSTSGSAGNLGFSSVTVTLGSTSYSNYITQCCTTPTNPLEIINTNLTVKMGETLPLSIEGTGNGNPNITWASLNGAVATVSGGVVTPVSTGKATITVSQAATGEFCEQYDEVEIEVIAANEFGISFTAAEGGSTVAKVNDTPTNKATTGTTVTITATPSDDYNFTGWTVNAGDVTLADASKATTTFVMGEADVEITPSFTLKKFTVTLNAGTGDVETTSYTEDVHTVIELPAAAHCQTDVWVFQGWSETNLTAAASECPALVDNNYEITKDVTLYAIYKKADGGEQTIGYKISYQVNNTTYYASAGVSAKKMSVSPNANDAVVFGMTTTSGQSKLYRVDANGTLISGSYIYLDSNKDLVQGADGDNDKHKWTISMTGTHSIINVGENGRCIAGRSGKDDLYVINASVANVDKPEGADGNYFHHITLIPVVKGAASYCTSPECVSLTWKNEMSNEQFVTYPADGKIVLPTETPTSCAPGLYSFVGWTAKDSWSGYKESDQGTVTAETAAPEHATTYYAEFVNTANNHYRTSCPEPLYAITYHANDGTESEYVVYTELTTSTTPTAEQAEFVKEGATLIGWTLNPNADEIEYVAPNTGLTGIDGNRDYYAVWVGSIQMSAPVRLTSAKDATVGSATFTLSSQDLGTITTLRFAYHDVDNNIWYRTSNRSKSEFRLCNPDYSLTNAEDNVNVSTSGTNFSKEYAIVYTPNSGNKMSHYQLVVELLNNSKVMAADTFDLYGRSLPDKFVIAEKRDNKWYALPANMENSDTYAGVEITVSGEGLNMGAFATENELYTLKTYSHDKSKVLFQSVANSGHLWAASGDGTGIKNDAKTISGENKPYAWIPTPTDETLLKYTLGNVNNSRTLAMYGEKFGMYASYGTNIVYFLPLKTITEQIEVADGKTRSLSEYEVDENTTIIVHAGGTLNADKVATIGNLTIERTGNKSGQVFETATLTANNAYFDVTLNATAMKWYDIAVPFKVDRLNGLSFPNGGTFPLNDVLVYNGATRAANGTNGSAWEYQDDGDLEPGKGYFIMFATDVETVRFTKKAGEKLNNEEDGSIIVEEFESQTDSEMDANWNYIANNTLHYVNLGFDETQNSGVLAQTYNPNTDSYVACAQNATTYLVGTPFFVQVDAADKVVWNIDETYSILRAPAMTTNRVERFTVELSANGEMNDRLFVSADENARNEYQIGKDVAKMGISSTIAQMWVENYNTKLCANEAVLFNDQASFSLGIFVPKNGEYTLTITNAPNNAELYLTENGQPIWNLSKGAYTTEWAKGTHKEYGLMLQVTDAKAPTNINGLNGGDKAVKFLKNSDIYILRNAKLYNAQGQLVK